MKWIRVASNVADDAKVWRIAELAGCDAFKAIGHLVTLWGVMTDQAKNGDLSPFSDSRVEMWAKWTGKRGKFAAAVRATLCDERGVMTAWEKYQGAAIREHETDQKRAAARRQAARSQPDGPADSPPDAPLDGPPLRNETIRDKRTTQPPSTRALALVEVATGTADSAVRPRLPAEYRPDLDALLDTLPADARPSWLRSMGAKLDGMHGPPVTPAQLGEALRAFGANGADRKLSLFDGYVRRAALPPRAPPNTALAATGTHGLDRRSAGAVSEANSLRGIALLLGEEPTHPDPEAR